MKRNFIIIKASILLLFFTVIQSKAYAQKSYCISSDNSMLGNFSEFYWGGFFSTGIKYTHFKEDYKGLLNIKGGAIVNEKLGFGMEFNFMLSKREFIGQGRELEFANLSSNFSYGGVFAEYILMNDRVWHPTIDFFLGPGGIIIVEQEEVSPGVFDEDIVEFSLMLVMEPGVNIEMNLTRNIRPYLGVSYRYIPNSHVDRLTGDEMGGLAINAGIKIGAFLNDYQSYRP